MVPFDLFPDSRTDLDLPLSLATSTFPSFDDLAPLGNRSAASAVLAALWNPCAISWTADSYAAWNDVQI